MERKLRQKAFQHLSFGRHPAFHDDSDMQAGFHIIVIYHSKTNTPLLSCRVFHNSKNIAQILGPNFSDESKEGFNLKSFSESELFMADRLAGNVESPLYKKYRKEVFTRFYVGISKLFPNQNYLLLARSTPGEVLLTKYLRLGLYIVGSTQLHEHKHWVVLGHTTKNSSYLKKMALLGIKFSLIKPLMKTS